VCNSDTTLFLVFSGTIHASTLPLFIPPKLLNIISSALFTRVTHITPSNPTTKMAPMPQHRTPHRSLIALVSRPQLSSSHIARAFHPKTHSHTHHHRSTRNLPFINKTLPLIKRILTSALHLPFIIDVTARLTKYAPPMRAADSTRFVDYMSGGEFVVCVFGDPGVGGRGVYPGGGGGDEEDGEEAGSASCDQPCRACNIQPCRCIDPASS
jgi:hypothetical protein